MRTFQELVAANPSQKNWKGISIAVCVILLVLASVAISVQIMTPPEEGPRVLGDRITVSHILNPDYRPRHFNGSWISGKMRFILFAFLDDFIISNRGIEELIHYLLF